jgi:hypothetical protein
LEGEIDAKELDRDLIAERLLKDTKEAKGVSFMSIAEKYSVLEMSPLRTFKSKKFQQKSLTSICYSPSGFLYTGSKDSIVKWNIKNAERLHVFANGKKKTKRIERRKLYKATDGHNNEILCVDASSDGRFMVSYFHTITEYEVNAVIYTAAVPSKFFKCSKIKFALLSLIILCKMEKSEFCSNTFCILSSFYVKFHF